MNSQIIIVLICLALAVIFMARKVVRALRRKSCACEDCGKGPKACSGGGICPQEKILKEITPIKRN